MDSPRWKFILHDWIRKTELIPTAVGSLEHIDVKLFYEKFRTKIQETNPSLENDLGSFLAANFPSFEVVLNESNNITSQDFMYIFSLVLYYSCVLRVNEFFQKCCRSLDVQHQSVVAKFFASLKQCQEGRQDITKASIRSAIRESSPSPPSIRFISSSPSMRTPDKMNPTPNKKILFEKSKELQKVKAMLENERYEKNIAEADAKQNEEKVDFLVKEQKILKHELQKLRTEQMIEKNSENLSPNKVVRDDQVRVKMQKEIDAREEIIVNLRCDIDALTSRNEKSSNRISLIERELRDLRRKYSDLDETVEALQEDVEEKIKVIRTLEESNTELMAFINETRSTFNKDSSSDCLDYSFSTSNTGGNSTDSGENLAKYVIDVQLKEKETENQKLLEELQQLTFDNEQLKLALTTSSGSVSSLKQELKEKSSSEVKFSEEVAKLKTLIEETNKNNDVTESEMQLSQKKILEMQVTIQQATQTNEDLTLALTTNSDSVSLLKHELEQKSYSEEKLLEEVAKLKILVEERNQESEVFKAEMQLSQKRILEMQVTIQQATQDNERLKVALDKKSELISSLQHELEQKSSSVVEFSEEVANLKTLVEDTIKAKDVTESEMQLSQEKILEMQVAIEQATQANEQLKHALDKNSDVVSSLQHELEQKSASVVEFSQEVAKLKTLVEERNQESEVLKAGMQHSKQKILELQVELQRKLRDYNAELKAAQESREEIQKLLESEKVRFETLHINHEEEIAKRDQELQNQMKEANTLKEKVLALEAKLQQEKGEFENTIAKLQGENKTLHLRAEESIRAHDKLTSLAAAEHREKLSELGLTIVELTRQCENKERQLFESTKQITALKEIHHEQVDSLKKQVHATKSTTSKEDQRVNELLKKLEDLENLKMNLKELEILNANAVECNELLNKEKLILNAKLMIERAEKDNMKQGFDQEKELLKSQFEKVNENVKETRLEMEGKLEKMKEKMKTIFNDEMQKKNAKYEEKLLEKQNIIESQNERIRMLENQCSANNGLKAKYNDLMFEHDHLSSKLRFLEQNGAMQMNGSIGMSRAPPTTTQINCANLGMEDEAGEEFNNTWLVDLQKGDSQFSLEKDNTYSVRELQKRNSMLPVHMRGSYAIVQTDHSISEHEMKDGALFDDSQTALLNVNNGPRKKQSTSYKRPGPPTPSKNSGRLSIDPGAVNVPNALKDSTNTANASKKTPSRFKSIFSSSSKKDVESIDMQRLPAHTMAPSRSKHLSKDEDEIGSSSNSNGSHRTKQESRQQQRNQARDQNRPNLTMNVPSPDYEVLSTSVDNGTTSSDEDDLDEKVANVRRSLNESFEHIKYREQWQQGQKRARRKHFARNRRGSSEISRQQSKQHNDDSTNGQETFETFMSAEDFSRYQSCASLDSETANEQLPLTPKKGINRNFLMSHHVDANRLSDYYVQPTKILYPEDHETTLQDVTWLNVRSFILGFFFAFATVFKSFFKTKE